MTDDARPTTLHIAVLMGGWSAERPVSLMSGHGCADALESLGHRVGGRTGEHRHGEEAGADDAEAEQQEGQRPGNRPQRLRRLRRRLDIGDAHIIRNAGGLPTDDVLRSLAISQRYLGTTEVLILHHTDCGMHGFDDTAFRATLAAESGTEPPWDVPGFTDIEAKVRESLEIVRSCGWIPHRDLVRGFVYDVETAKITEVTA